MKLSLIFPASNEAASITSVLERWSEYCVTKNIDHEIIVVNDGSRDATSEIVQDFARTQPSVRLIELAQNQGYGAALRTGFAAASGDYVFFTDSDGQFQPEDLVQTMPLLKAETMVLGYRQHRVEGIVRRMNAWGWSRCVGWTLDVRVRDLNCAWKAFPRTLLSDIMLISTGAFINAELLYHARKKKFVFQEISVQHFPRQSGSPTGANIRVIWRAFQELVNFFKQRNRREKTVFRDFQIKNTFPSTKP